MATIGDSRLPTRFWDKVTLSQAGCWEWTASTRAGGYGYFHWQGKDDLAHRAAYMALVGPIPAGLSLDHLCRVKHCANPEHLEPVTHRTNVLRGEAPTARKARAMECPKGHPYPANQVPGKRFCAQCIRTRKQQERERYANDSVYRAHVVARSAARHQRIRSGT